MKGVNDNHQVKKGFNNKVKPPITLRKSINKLNYGCIESMTRRLKPEVISRKSQKHKLCNVDTSDKCCYAIS